MPFHKRVPRAAGTYEEMKTGPHHVFKITGGKSGLYGWVDATSDW